MDSLILNGLELLGTATNPEYRLGQGLDLGAPEPDQSTIASLLLDGDTVSGDRYRNRSINLSVRVFSLLPSTSTTAQVRAALTRYVDTLMSALSAKTFTLQWTPDGGLPLVFDCFRGRPERQRTIVGDNQGVTLVTLTLALKPFGRSTVAQTIASAAQLQVDSFATAPTGATLNTTTKYEGTGSAQVSSFTYTSTGHPGSTSGAVSRSFASTDLSSYSSMSLRMYRPTVTSAPETSVTLTLASAGGSTRYSSTPIPLGVTKWGIAYIPLTGGTVVSGTGVDLTAVTSYSLTLFVAFTDIHATYMLIDDLRALPAASSGGSTANGAVLLLGDVLGSARAPVALDVTRSGGNLNSLLLHSPPDDEDTDASILIGLNTTLSNQTITVAAPNSGYDGTYAIYLAVATNGAAGVNVLTFVIKQFVNGVLVATETTQPQYASPYQGKLVPLGEHTLPLRAVPDDNTTTTYTIQVWRNSGADLYSDLAFCDTSGQTILVSSLPASAAHIYVDEPDPKTGFGQIYATASDRSAAYGVLDGCAISGGSISFEPGANRLLALSPDGAPAAVGTYSPRWLDERVV